MVVVCYSYETHGRSCIVTCSVCSNLPTIETQHAQIMHKTNKQHNNKQRDFSKFTQTYTCTWQTCSKLAQNFPSKLGKFSINLPIYGKVCTFHTEKGKFAIIWECFGKTCPKNGKVLGKFWESFPFVRASLLQVWGKFDLRMCEFSGSLQQVCHSQCILNVDWNNVWGNPNEN